MARRDTVNSFYTAQDDDDTDQFTDARGTFTVMPNDAYNSSDVKEAQERATNSNTAQRTAHMIASEPVPQDVVDEREDLEREYSKRTVRNNNISVIEEVEEENERSGSLKES